MIRAVPRERQTMTPQRHKDTKGNVGENPGPPLCLCVFVVIFSFCFPALTREVLQLKTPGPTPAREPAYSSGHPFLSVSSAFIFFKKMAFTPRETMGMAHPC